MAADPHAELDTIHARLRALLADMIGPIAVGEDGETAAELAEMVRAVFGVELSVETILSSPKPAGLASAIEAAWFDGGGTAEELGERVAGLTEDEDWLD
jgi:hypothetical protein